MQSPPDLFDADLLALRRARATRMRSANDFLREAVADEVAERITEVNRTFRHAALIGPRPDIWTPKLREAGVGEVTAHADGDALGLRDGAYDLVVHAMALHWSNDPVGQLVQARRALEPDGLLICTAFGGETLRELREALTNAESVILGGISPRIAPVGEIRALGSLLQRAGLALPVADSARYDVAYERLADLARDLRIMGETNVMRDRSRRMAPRALFEACEAAYAANFADDEGRLRATFEVVFLTGWAPAPDQPKPLRPGSAKTRLADALGAIERSADEKAGR